MLEDQVPVYGLEQDLAQASFQQLNWVFSLDWLARHARANWEENAGSAEDHPSLWTNDALDICSRVQMRGMIGCIDRCIDFSVLLEEIRAL